MATAKKPLKKTADKTVKKTPLYMRPVKAIHTRATGFMARRPHRSFRLTRRRDYDRSLKLPGYFAFTKQVRQLLWENKKIFISLVALYGIVTIIFVGTTSQDLFTTLGDTLKETGSEVFTGNFGGVAQAGLLFVATISGASTQTLTEVQQIFAVIIALLTWLTTVWLLRNIMAGHKVTMRDGLYNAGAPIVPSFGVLIVLALQLLPIAVALLGYTAASATGLLEGGIEAMVFWFVVALLVLLSLYWATGTLIAMVVITLPGMYPLQAIRAAGDMVVGRRIRILLRILWMIAGLAVVWILILLPVIVFDTWIKTIFTQIAAVPLVPFVMLVVASFSVVWSASYIYLLYRKVVDDDALPA